MKKLYRVLVIAILSFVVLFSGIVVFAEENPTAEELQGVKDKQSEIEQKIEDILNWQEQNNIDMIVESYEAAKTAYDEISLKLDRRTTWLAILVTIWTILGVALPIYDRLSFSKTNEKLKATSNKLKKLEDSEKEMNKRFVISSQEQYIQELKLRREISRSKNSKMNTQAIQDWDSMIINSIRTLLLVDSLTREQRISWHRNLAKEYANIGKFNEFSENMECAYAIAESNNDKYMIVFEKAEELFSCCIFDSHATNSEVKQAVNEFKRAQALSDEGSEKFFFEICWCYSILFKEDDYIVNKIIDFEDYLYYVEQEFDDLKTQENPKQEIANAVNEVGKLFYSKFGILEDDLFSVERLNELYDRVGVEEFIKENISQLKRLIK